SRRDEAPGARADRVEERNRDRPHLDGEDLAHGEIRRTGSGGGYEENRAQAHYLRGRSERLVREGVAHREEPDARQGIGRRDHLAAADAIEELSQPQRPPDIYAGGTRRGGE